MQPQLQICLTLAICRSAYMALNLLRRNVPEASTSIGIRKRLYLALVRSQLSYCSQLWRPRLMKDIVCLEKVQRRASKYILGDRESDYRSRLITLNLLPLMYWLELQDLIFCVKSLQSPSDNFNIRNYLQFSTSSTRSSGCKLLYKASCSSTTRHFYLRIVLLECQPSHRHLSLFGHHQTTSYTIHVELFFNPF